MKARKRARRNAGPGFAAILLLALAALFAPGVAWCGEPTEQIRGAIDRGLAILKRPDLQGEAKKAERRALLRKEIFPYFAFDEMARRTLGVHWKERTPQERQEFVALFTDLLENTYAGKIEGYKGEKIVYGAEKVEPPYAEVRTKVVTRQGEEFSMDYRLLKASDRWRVYDVVIEGVSLVSNYRSQFSDILRKSSFEELTRKLRETVRKQPG